MTEAERSLPSVGRRSLTTYYHFSLGIRPYHSPDGPEQYLFAFVTISPSPSPHLHPTNTVTTMSKVVSYSELQANNTKQNLWVAIHGKVYNVTKFIDEHPGGEEVIISEGGKDATEAFEDVGHSDEARGLLPDLLVGELDEASVSIQFNPPEQENSSQKDDNVLLEVRINIGPSLRHC
ncbi:Cytochrome b5-like heme/steroid binding domain containing protein, partial [Tylopilus felleus]